MKDSQDWLDEILETEPHRTGLHEDSGNGDPCYCTTKSAIRKHILQEDLEARIDELAMLPIHDKQVAVNASLIRMRIAELRDKFNDKYKED